MIATTLTVLAWPLSAQETPTQLKSPEAPKSEIREMREVIRRTSTDDVVKPWRIGLMVAPLDPALRDHLDLPEKSGVIVSQCLDQGPAAKAGIKVKDIILSVNGRPVDSIEPLRESVMVSAKTGKELRLAIISKGLRREVVIKPDAPKPPVVRPNADRAPNLSDAKMREQEIVIRRMMEQHKTLLSRLEKQQSDMKKMNDSIEQLSKALREMKQSSKESDKKP